MSLKNLWARFVDTFNEAKYEHGFLVDWYRSGYGLNPFKEDTNDQYFLEHAFGFKVGHERNATSISYRKDMDGRRIDSIGASAHELLSTYTMSGRKKMIKGYSAWTTAAVNQAIANHDAAKKMAAVDPRPGFLRDIRTSAYAFAEHVKAKFGITDFSTTPFSIQKRIMVEISTSADVFQFIPGGDLRKDIQEKRHVKKSKTAVLDMSMVELDTVTTCPTARRKIHALLQAETTQELVDEEKYDTKRAKEAATKNILSDILEALGKSRSGSKDVLFERARDVIGEKTLRELIWRMVDEGKRISALCCRQQYCVCGGSTFIST